MSRGVFAVRAVQVCGARVRVGTRVSVCWTCILCVLTDNERPAATAAAMHSQRNIKLYYAINAEKKQKKKPIATWRLRMYNNDGG